MDEKKSAGTIHFPRLLAGVALAFSIERAVLAALDFCQLLIDRSGVYSVVCTHYSKERLRFHVTFVTLQL
jgi:hypothetical protein